MRRTVLPLALLALACEPEVDRVAVIYGEEFIEESIPASVFVDGWSVTFTKFLVSVGEVTLDDEPLLDPRFQVVDLARPSEGEGFWLGASDGHRDEGGRVSYVIGPSADPRAVNADADDVALMKQEGYSIYVFGHASRDVEQRTFAWGFSTRTVYRDCEVDGIGIELTIHGDHLFYDDLVSSTPNVAFDLIAGAGAGEITPDLLRAVDITTEERYQVGDLTHITDLWAFIEQQTATLGHIDGEGHCEATRED